MGTQQREHTDPIPEPEHSTLLAIEAAYSNNAPQLLTWSSSQQVAYRQVRLTTTSLGARKAAAQPPGCQDPVNTMVLSSTFSITLVDCSPMCDALLAYSFFSSTCDAKAHSQ